MIEPGVIVAREGSVGRLTLNRPDKHNAVTARMLSQVVQGLDTLENDPAVRVVVVSGSGPTFCSGAALDEMSSGAMSGERFQELTDRLDRVTLPTIASLNGNTYGGGGEIALCCDFRIAEPHVELAVTAAQLGICYPFAGVQRYVERCGPGASARILLAAERMNAQELERIGFITHLAPSGGLEAATTELATRLAEMAPLAIRHMKHFIRTAATEAVSNASSRDREAQCAESADAEEGLAAWREGRPPRFEGR